MSTLATLGSQARFYYKTEKVRTRNKGLKENDYSPQFLFYSLFFLKPELETYDISNNEFCKMKYPKFEISKN